MCDMLPYYSQVTGIVYWIYSRFSTRSSIWTGRIRTRRRRPTTCDGLPCKARTVTSHRRVYCIVLHSITDLSFNGQ